MRGWFAVIAALLLAGCTISLKGRLEAELNAVDYRDGVNMREADVIAHHYRMNNLKWTALDSPNEDGDYWSFKLLHGRNYELLDELPLLIFKRAWSYKSAVILGKKPVTQVAPVESVPAVK